jgi:hypothetical protein
MWPEAGVIPAALETVQALEIWSVRRRQTADRHDAVARGVLPSVRGLDFPVVAGFGVVRVLDADVELDVG